MESTGFSSLSWSICEITSYVCGQFLFVSQQLLTLLFFPSCLICMLVWFISFSALSLLLLTGSGGNPNGGSGFQSGVWVLAGCQGRYAPLPMTTSLTVEWRCSFLLIFSLCSLFLFSLPAVYILYVSLLILSHNCLGFDTLLGQVKYWRLVSLVVSQIHAKECPNWIHPQRLNHHP